ncbi:MAG: zinc-dependent metalloprotease [Actinomycetes bacterium]
MADGVVDWGVAVATATRLAGAGPRLELGEARAAVADLRTCAREAVGYVAEHTGLVAPATPGAVTVVDRRGWVSANVEGFAEVIDPVLTRLRARRSAPPSALLAAVAGAEIGAALGFMGSKVLGQFELFTAAGRKPRLLLVAPNVVEVERQLDVDPHDFRLWVCLHEETHRVQFSAIEWLGPWLRSEIEGYLELLDLDPQALAERLRQVRGTVLGALRGLDAIAVLEQMMSPPEREVLDRLTAVMSLLEGHADVVMDGVGPEVVSSVATIRQRFQQRRTDPSAGEALVRRLLGVDSKLKQYRDGARFVSAVVDQVGMTGFNHVWTSPETLPTRAELDDPSGWVRRVVGPTVAPA